MNSLLIIFSSIIVIFFIALLIKSFLSSKNQKNFCAICIAISLTWLIFLIASWLNLFTNKLILAILLGQSSLAIFYILEKKQALQFFRLPILLALTLAAYALVNINSMRELFQPIVLVAGLSIIFLFIFSIKSNTLAPFIKKVVECCKRW